MKNAKIQPGAVVADLMTGMGECWAPILKGCGSNGKLIALDFSEGMLRFAHKRKSKLNSSNIEVLQRNVFESGIPSNSVDAIISGFGIKTFSDEQLEAFATEVKRMLKPNGTFSFVEVAVPSNPLLKAFYMFYVQRIIPTLGWLLVGNPDNYRMLGVYTSKFGNAQRAQELFSKIGLESNLVSYFNGCASGISGKKKGE